MFATNDVITQSIPNLNFDRSTFIVDSAGEQRDLLVLRGPRVPAGTCGSGVILMVPGSGGSFKQLTNKSIWPDCWATKIVVLVDVRSPQPGHAGKPFKALLLMYILDISSRLLQLAHAGKVGCYWIGFSRGAMWGSYVAHKHPQWFNGFLLVDVYPVWFGERDMKKAAQQLIQTCNAQVAVVHSLSDEHSNPRMHPGYWQYILTPLAGDKLGQRSKSVKVWTFGQDLHAQLEPRCYTAAPPFREWWLHVSLAWE